MDLRVSEYYTECTRTVHALPKFKACIIYHNREPAENSSEALLYYSSQCQFELLLQSLDERYESLLVRHLRHQSETIFSQMDITEQLTLELLGAPASASARKTPGAAPTSTSTGGGGVSVLEQENREAARALLQLLPLPSASAAAATGSEHSASSLFRGRSHAHSPLCALHRDYIEQIASSTSNTPESKAASSHCERSRDPELELEQEPDGRVVAAHGAHQLSSSERIACAMLGSCVEVEPDGALVVRKECERELRVRLAIAKPSAEDTRASSVAKANAPFRLGEEGSFRRYVNEFTINPLALNKQQHAEERDKRRYLQHKFSLALTGELEFRWPTWNLFGGASSQLDTIRLALCLLEASLPACFFHSQWSTARASWFDQLSRYRL